jgi:hypothetical protein
MSMTPTTEARQPQHRLALVSLVAALYTPVAVPLALLLYQLALAASGPPVCQPGSDHCLSGETLLADLLGIVVYGLVV